MIFFLRVRLVHCRHRRWFVLDHVSQDVLVVLGVIRWLDGARSVVVRNVVFFFFIETLTEKVS